jgi:PBSX family phage terminase large subunit
MLINFKQLNPVGFHLMKLLQDIIIRLIILYGGSSSGKSYSVAQLILLMTLYDGENTLVMRKVGASINKTIYEDFKVAARQLGVFNLFKFKDGVRQIVCIDNGAKIDFGGLDDPEKIKGISNYKRVFMDEWSEYESEDFKQVRKRLRGKVGQQIITAFNPIKETHWIKKEIFDVEKWHDIPMEVSIAGRPIPSELTQVKSIRMNEPKMILNPRTKEYEEHAPDTVVIQSTYLNNFWVVGSPDGTYGYYDEQCIADFEKDRINDPDYYNVYALGEWGVLRTGSEFFGSFNRGQHSREVEYDPRLPIHLSVDNNVLPYISFTFWQVDTSNGYDIRQIDEICAESPNNTVRKAAKLVAERIKQYNPEAVYLHGDASTRAANNIDDEKRSWLDLLIDCLAKEGVEVIDCVGNKNPSVSLSGEFINAIYDNTFPEITLTIGENCKTSIEDYMSVQKDVNGAILKTRVKNKITMQTYEEHGHLSDTKRYIVVDILKDEFTAFSNQRKRNIYARNGFLHFYNPNTECKYTEDVVYCMPNINGRFVMVHGKMCGAKWHIVGAAFRDTDSTEEIKGVLLSEKCDCIIVECGPAYYPFVRELRECVEEVRLYRETPDIDRRIAATSDFVKCNVLFSEDQTNGNGEYASFMSNLFDYNKDVDNKEASAVLSGFVKFVVKSFSE